MCNFLPLRSFIATIIFLSFALNLFGWNNKELIHIYSEASEEYLAQRSSDTPETYKFYESKSFKEFASKSLKDVEFIDVARGLVPHLAKQNYLPVQKGQTCDLVLVVTWGKTHVPDNETLHDGSDWVLGTGASYQDLIADGYTDKPLSMNATVQAAKLVGFYPFLDDFRAKPYYSFEETELTSLLRIERYFIIVSAFDYQVLMGEHRWKGLWATRFSMSSPGVDFSKAHLALSKAGADYFGKNLEKLGKTRTDLDSIVGEVEMGEIEILDSIEIPE